MKIQEDTLLLLHLLTTEDSMCTLGTQHRKCLSNNSQILPLLYMAKVFLVTTLSMANSRIKFSFNGHFERW